jgi:hypothetical protein
MMRILWTILLLAVTVPAGAASGIQGRAAWRGEVGAGVKVRAYRSVADIAAGKEVAVSTPTALDGTYRLELPPGNYYLTARDFDGAPQPGRLFCYYSGAPVTVRDGAYTNVGFNLIRVPQEAPATAGAASGIKGEITFQGAALERAYLYVYKDGRDGFKGPGYVIQPVEKGTFRLRLPPGEYYLLARKRAKGGQFGPIETGDYFNYYYGNPVRIEAGQIRDIKLETITRLSMLEEGPTAAFRGVRGRVLGSNGKPVQGVHVFGYRAAAMTGTPAVFSTPTAGDGSFELPLGDDGPYYLLAREAFGGPAGEGELYGRLEKPALRLDAEHPVREVTIYVEAKHDR